MPHRRAYISAVVVLRKVVHGNVGCRGPDFALRLYAALVALRGPLHPVTITARVPMRSSSVFLASFLFLSGCSLVMDTSPADPAYTSITGDGGMVACSRDASCDDGNPCNGIETCGSAGFCVPGTEVVCPNTGCLVGHCKPDGSCVTVPTDSACTDDISCTHDSCSDVGRCEHVLDDTACDDGRSCTADVCVGVAIGTQRSGCYSVPQDNLCAQPVGGANMCAANVCAPSATADVTGCAVAPSAVGCTTGKRCNLETFQCELLPTNNCDACDDGDPCNGVETCAGTGTVTYCLAGTSCAARVTNACERGVCNQFATDPANACVVVRRVDAMCIAPIVVGG